MIVSVVNRKSEVSHNAGRTVIHLVTPFYCTVYWPKFSEVAACSIFGCIGTDVLTYTKVILFTKVNLRF